MVHQFLSRDVSLPNTWSDSGICKSVFIDFCSLPVNIVKFKPAVVRHMAKKWSEESSPDYMGSSVPRRRE